LESSINDTQHIEDHIKSSISIKQSILLDTTLVHKIDEVAKVCVNAYKNGNKVILAGNGGSAADSQHIAAEFVSRFRFDRPGLPSIALSTDTSMLTAIGNDYGYKNLFKRQLEANGRNGDIFIAITTSGNSENIIQAVSACPDLGIKSVGLVGNGGGKLSNMSDYTICVPSDKTELIQESQIMIGHIICGYVEDSIFG
tara:strand:- start:7345 stop:7938 length:594 start_codon:yes stop_codon:yes gene_type:complete